MKVYHYLMLALLIAAMGFAGCASAPGSATQQGAVVGAAGGAVAGQAIGEDTEATLLGAAVGAAAGALIGEQVGNRQEEAADAEREEVIRSQEAEIERLRREKAAAQAAAQEPQYDREYEPTTAEPTRSVAKIVDPTEGVFINNTGWLVELFVDSSDVQRTPDLTLNPYERVPETLDIGTHRIYAVAYAQTSRGLRIVGEFNEVIEIDVRGRGWNLTFTEASF